MRERSPDPVVSRVRTEWYPTFVMPDTPDELIRLGYQARRTCRLEDARRIFAHSVGVCRETADPLSLGASLIGLGQTERDLKNSAAALQHYREAVDILRSGADRLRSAHTIRHLADILREEGSLELARPLYEEALEIYREQKDTQPLDMANAIRGFALLRGLAGESDEATLLWQEARKLYALLDVRAGVQESVTQIARLTAK